ncbi:hypothetical protein CBM2633_A70163 [Cupriavidus taiwanensis]|nr:hypothetical protein CBM2609_A100165 [Cupriavidus taiwanensis]SOZ41817.1 hypothetical protein CBM2610_A100163 [Cupriavidus taiwanensis]SOZ97755.1 hypothetical protein CBM2626_A130101 [Cupriavidus taiwanensis]SPA16070.1 hypothetical protein CBM2633_A70163 [Cupriavidus taiwanensis]
MAQRLRGAFMVRGGRSASGITPTEQRLAFTLISFRCVTRQARLAAHAWLAKVLAKPLVRVGKAKEFQPRAPAAGGPQTGRRRHLRWYD